MREIIPRTAVGAETATMLTDSGITQATGISNAPPVTNSSSQTTGSQNGTAIAVLAIGIGGALYFMSKERAGFQIGKVKEAEIWLDRVERQAYRAGESKDLTPAQRGAIEDVRMCAESAYGKFKPGIGPLR